MEIKSYNYQINRKKTWDEVFRSPIDMGVTSFQTGTVKINLKGTLNPKLADVRDKELQVPILSYWVKHAHKGDILLDAGLDASYIHDPKGGLHGPAVDEFQLDSKGNIGYYIQKNKISLNMVFLSHLHADHTAGVRELPRNMPYIMGKGEYQHYHPEIHGNFLEGLDTLFEIDFSHAQAMPYLGRCVDLLGDGSLWAIGTQGHTPGHMSFLINNREGPVLLAMDAAFIQKNLELGIASSDYTWDVEQAQESLDKIIKFLEQYPQVRVGPGHEAVLNNFKTNL